MAIFSIGAHSNRILQRVLWASEIPAKDNNPTKAKETFIITILECDLECWDETANMVWS